MTSFILAPSPSEAIPGPLKNKRVLLVDESETKRDLRADTMRKLGMDVDCAADIGEARYWWRADLYNLVLISVKKELSHRDKFCEDVRSATPPQQLAFLVGKPDYLAALPNDDRAPSIQNGREEPQLGDGVVSAKVPERRGERWGILEACRRISLARSVAHARSRVMRERPAPARDAEARYSKTTAAWSQLLPELQKDDMQ